MENNTILKAIEEDLVKYKNDFVLVENQIQDLVDKREQIRGAYTALYNQYIKFKENSSEPENNVEKESVKEDIKKSVEEADEKPKRNRKSKEEKPEVKERVVAGLSKEEIEKINQAIPQPNMKDSNGNEIPSYLQTEYNK